MNKILLTTISLIIALFLSGISYGQNNNREFKLNMSSGTLEVSDLDDVVITGYQGTELIITTQIEDEEADNRARGMKVLNSYGLDDNTGFGLAVEQEGAKVLVQQIKAECDCETIEIQVPFNVNVVVSHSTHDAESLVIKNIESELVVTTSYHDIKLENVTGPMAIQTVYGDIDGQFKQLSQEGSISIYSVYGYVDISLPQSTNANATLITPWGDVYSDIDMEITKSAATEKSKNSCNAEGQSIKGKLNNGGVELNIKSAYDNVYLRKI